MKLLTTPVFSVSLVLLSSVITISLDNVFSGVVSGWGTLGSGEDTVAALHQVPRVLCVVTRV